MVQPSTPAYSQDKDMQSDTAQDKEKDWNTMVWQKCLQLKDNFMALILQMNGAWQRDGECFAVNMVDGTELEGIFLYSSKHKSDILQKK